MHARHWLHCDTSIIDTTSLGLGFITWLLALVPPMHTKMLQVQGPVLLAGLGVYGPCSHPPLHVPIVCCYFLMTLGVTGASTAQHAEQGMAQD